MEGKCFMPRMCTEKWRTFPAPILMRIDFIFNGLGRGIIGAPSSMNVCIPDFTGGVFDSFAREVYPFWVLLAKNVTACAFIVPR